jgi:hypothetical protein
MYLLVTEPLARSIRPGQPPSPLAAAFASITRRSTSQVFPSQTVGIIQTDDRIWLVSFMDYDLGYFDDETCRLEPLANPFGPKGLPMSSD